MKTSPPKTHLSPVPVLAVAALVMSGTSQPVLAQEQGEKPRLVLEEVLVTATKTEELASDVPISANVLTSENLNNIGATDFTEVSKLAPGLDFGSTRDPISGAIKLRNVGSDSFEGGADKAVAVFVDGFAQAQPNTVFSTLYDVERIEVLRGPQGTLYGKNAPAGVISIKTRRPDFDGIGGYAKGTLSSDNTYVAEGALNTPITDKLAIRVSGVTTESDGYFTNKFLNNDSGAYNRKDGRIKLLFVPNDDLVFLLAYKNANLNSLVAKKLYDGEVPNSTGLGPNGGPIISDPEDYYTYGQDNQRSDADIQDATLTVEWQLGDYAITSLTGYSELDFQLTGGNNAIPVDDTILTNGSLTRQVTEELRISNDGMEDLEWLAGIYYSHNNRSGGTKLGQLDFGGDTIGETWGYFANAAYYLTDQWKISAGLRYNDEKKAKNINPLVGSPLSVSDNYYQTSGSFKLQYYWTPDIMFYVSADSAYRSGDFNDFALGLGSSSYVGSVPGAAEFTQHYGSFKPETSESYEMGMKGSFMGGRAKGDITVFHQVYHDYQLNQAPNNAAPWVGTISLATFVPGAIVPVDKLITEGVEMSGQMLFTENWSGSASLAYAHAVADEFSNKLCAKGEAPTGQLYCSGNGTRLNDDPLWNGNFQLAYQNNWAEYDYSARLIANYKSAPTYDNGEGTSVDWDQYNSAYVTWDLNFSLSPESGDWSATVWGKNLTDEARPAAEGILNANGVQTLEYGTFIPPRTFGVTGQYNF